MKIGVDYGRVQLCGHQSVWKCLAIMKSIWYGLITYANLYWNMWNVKNYTELKRLRKWTKCNCERIIYVRYLSTILVVSKHLYYCSLFTSFLCTSFCLYKNTLLLFATYKTNRIQQLGTPYKFLNSPFTPVVDLRNNLSQLWNQTKIQVLVLYNLCLLYTSRCV